MPHFKLLSQKIFQARGISLLSGGLVVLLCWLLAQWTWLVLSPKGRLAPADDTMFSAPAAADAIIAAHFFGAAGGVDLSPQQVQPASNLRLHGVFAAIGSLPAFAILSVDGKVDQPVKVGADIAPGLMLAAVYPDHVVVLRQGVPERLDLEPKVAGQHAVSDVPDFRLNVHVRGPGNYTVSRNELNQALQDPKQVSNLGRFSSQPGVAGMTVAYAPGNSLAGKMGLQQGDVVLRVNGQPVNSNEDISRFYQQLQQMSQVRLEGLRSGKPLLLSYTIQ